MEGRKMDNVGLTLFSHGALKKIASLKHNKREMNSKIVSLLPDHASSTRLHAERYVLGVLAPMPKGLVPASCAGDTKRENRQSEN